MLKTRVLIVGALGALVAGGLAVVPALGATETGAHLTKRATPITRSFGSFTPAAADPRLAAVFARGGLDDGDFRFTPSETRRSNRAVTVAVRARSSQAFAGDDRIAQITPPTLGLAPIAYNLGVAVGWKRFALSGDVARVDLAAQPGSREAADVAVSYSANRFTGRVKAIADRPLEGTAAPQALDTLRSYSLDVGGSYSLTRNLDVTAGMRYRTDRDRMTRISDDRRDSQAVYVGTAFRF